MPRKAKLVLPTIDTCRWREVQAGTASCGLISSLVGSSPAIVSEDACRVCCESFPPSPAQLNPVVAGLLFDSASKILAIGGTEDCDKATATRLKREAELALKIIHAPSAVAMPARSVDTCCWLGEPTTVVAAGSLADVDELVHRCRHPRYGQTTLSKCRMCQDWAQHAPISRLLTLAELVPPHERRCGSPVRRWAVGVTTSPRRTPTLELTLDSIVRAGWSEPRLFLDGTIHLPRRYDLLPVTWREDCIGAWPSWYMALAELILRQPDADAYVMLQDDVVLYDRESLREYLQCVLWPGDRPGLVSLFFTGHNSTSGWFEAQGAWHFSAQGFVIPPGIARALLCDTDLSRVWLAASALTHIPIPEVIYEWVRRRGIDVWYANPSLAQHIGNTSTIWKNASIRDGRRASWFSGSVETAWRENESLADFPEDNFECADAARNDYLQRVECGRQHMSDHAVVVCGLCRDVRVYLPRTAARIERLGEMFRDYRVVLFENDSVDATCEFLTDWQSKNPRLDVISESIGATKFPQDRSLERAGWLARCRNRYRERILQQYAEFDYVIVVDTDLPGGWSYDGVAHTFGHQDWDFVGSFGVKPRLDRCADKPPLVHQDVWAFRPATGTAARKLVNHNDLHVRRGEPMLPVESCFGGLGVYRMQCMRTSEYGGTDCEHVVLHDRLRRAGLDGMFLNPSQIVLY